RLARVFPKLGRPSPPLTSLFLFPPRSACRKDRLPLGGFGRFPLRLLGQPLRLGRFPGLTFGSATRGFRTLPRCPLGPFSAFRCSSSRPALCNPAVTGCDNFLTSL